MVKLFADCPKGGCLLYLGRIILSIFTIRNFFAFHFAGPSIASKLPSPFDLFSGQQNKTHASIEVPVRRYVYMRMHVK